jgi:hypothetical protein
MPSVPSRHLKESSHLLDAAASVRERDVSCLVHRFRVYVAPEKTEWPSWNSTSFFQITAGHVID